MKTLVKFALAGVTLVLSAQAALAQAPSRPFLTGKWEGIMTGVGPLADGSPAVLPPFDAQRGTYGYRLDIGATNLVMQFQDGNGQWISFGEGQDLRLNEQGRTAIVIAALGASNGGIDAMMINIVRWDEDTIAVHVSRVTGAAGGDLPPAPVNSMGRLNRANF